LIEGIKKDLREFEGHEVAWAQRSANGADLVLAQERLRIKIKLGFHFILVLVLYLSEV
jgi:hypothetical protein